MEHFIHQNLWWLDPLAALISGLFGLALWKMRRHTLRMAVLRLLVIARRTFHRPEQRELPKPPALGRLTIGVMAGSMAISPFASKGIQWPNGSTKW